MFSGIFGGFIGALCEDPMFRGPRGRRGGTLAEGPYGGDWDRLDDGRGGLSYPGADGIVTKPSCVEPWSFDDDAGVAFNLANR